MSSWPFGVDISQATNEQLRGFACLAALEVVELWDCPEEVRAWLGEPDADARVAVHEAAWEAANQSPGLDARAAALAAASAMSPNVGAASAQGAGFYASEALAEAAISKAAASQPGRSRVAFKAAGNDAREAAGLRLAEVLEGVLG